MKINQLHYFIEVVDCKNISLAAKKLYISQPSLSRYIRNLENSIGKKLLNRTSRGVEPTSIGNQLYFHAQSIQNQLLMIENLKNTDSQNPINRLNISIGSLFLKDDIFLKFYKKTNSLNTELCLFETTVEDALQNVINAKSEFAIVILNDNQLPILYKMVESNKLTTKILDKSPIYFHLNKDHPLSYKKNIYPYELSNYPYIRLPYDFFSNINYSLKKDEIEKNSNQKTITVNNYNSILNMLRHTEGYILGDKWEIEELSQLSICSSLVEGTNVQQNFILVKRNREILSKYDKIFLDILKESYNFLDISKLI